MTRDELLRNETNKEPGLDIDRRVFYTLTGAKHGAPLQKLDPTVRRTAKLLTLLVAKLSEDGRLSEAELDEMLLHVIR